MKFWIGVASRDHVKRGEAGGFCQLGHGKAQPLRRLSAGDRIVYYSPRDRLDGGEPLQAFTAIGEILPGDIAQVEMAGGFQMSRRAVNFFPSRDAPIRLLLEHLSFAGPGWGAVMRRGLVSITEADYRVIAAAMQAPDPLLGG